MDKFWNEWDAIAYRRESLLNERPINWDEVKATLQESNSLLKDTPDRQLQRLARLSRILLDFDLDSLDSMIYIIYSSHAPYVGQTGCISGPRSLMDRFKEHVSKTKLLKAFFTSTRYRRARNLMGFGKMPSLARLMAREGPAFFSIMGVERVPRNINGGILERSWFHRVGVNLNQVEPCRCHFFAPRSSCHVLAVCRCFHLGATTGSTGRACPGTCLRPVPAQAQTPTHALLRRCLDAHCTASLILCPWSVLPVLDPCALRALGRPTTFLGSYEGGG